MAVFVVTSHICLGEAVEAVEAVKAVSAIDTKNYKVLSGLSTESIDAYKRPTPCEA